MTHTNHQLILGTAFVLLLLGAGCAKQSSPTLPDGGLQPAAPVPVDPLADDLDAAVEELRLIDGQ